jgi:hypothetical protein
MTQAQTLISIWETEIGIANSKIIDLQRINADLLYAAEQAVKVYPAQMRGSLLEEAIAAAKAAS